MKYFYTLLVAGLLVSASYATVLTVNNNVNAIGMFSNAQLAIDSAYVGDTIFLHGSPTSYGALVINKRITIVGEGYINSTDGLSKKTLVTTVKIDSLAGGDPVSGVVVNGLYMTELGYSGLYQVHNVVVKNSYTIQRILANGQDWEIINCKVGWDIRKGNGTVNNISVYNSVVIGHGYGYSFFGFRGGLISNCVIVRYINDCQFMQIQNSIFTMTGNYVATNCNNMAVIYSTFNDAQVINSSLSNTATNCLFEIFPRFINETNYQLDPTGQLQGTENPLVDGGTDGKDIGISGGSYPLKILDGRINYPQVHQVEVVTGVIEPGEDLIINVHARTRK